MCGEQRSGVDYQEWPVGEVPLFERKEARFKRVYRVFACTLLVGICLIWFYRLTNYSVQLPSSSGRRWVWLGMWMAEVCFGIYWILTQSVRWDVSYAQPHKDRLSQRLCFTISLNIFIISSLTS